MRRFQHASVSRGGEGLHTIHVRFDENPAGGWGSSESTDKESLFIAPHFATKMIVREAVLTKNKTLLVEFTPFNASPAIIGPADLRAPLI